MTRFCFLLRLHLIFLFCLHVISKVKSRAPIYHYHCQLIHYRPLFFPIITQLPRSLHSTIKLTVSFLFPHRKRRRKRRVYSTVAICLRHRASPESRWRTLLSLQMSSPRVPPKLCSLVAQVSNLRILSRILSEIRSNSTAFFFFWFLLMVSANMRQGREDWKSKESSLNSQRSEFTWKISPWSPSQLSGRVRVPRC